MDNSVLLNVLALVASFAALGISVIASYMQIRLSHRANQLPVLVELFREYRSPRFLTEEEQLWKELPQASPDDGFAGLPSPLRDHVLNVSNYYQTLAYLSLLGVVDDKVAVLPLHYRALKTWQAIEPFVLRERIIRGDELAFFNVLEEFIRKVRRVDIARQVEEVRRAFST
jgi:hypothetical protein